MSAGQITAPSPRLRTPLVSALIVGAFAVGVVTGFGPLRGLGTAAPHTAAGGSTGQAALTVARRDRVKDDVYVAAARADKTKDDVYMQAATRGDRVKDDVYVAAARADRLKDDVYTPSR